MTEVLSNKEARALFQKGAKPTSAKKQEAQKRATLEKMSGVSETSTGTIEYKKVIEKDEQGNKIVTRWIYPGGKI